MIYSAVVEKISKKKKKFVGIIHGRTIVECKEKLKRINPKYRLDGKIWHEYRYNRENNKNIKRMEE